MTLDDFRSHIAQSLGLDNTASSTEQGFIDDWVNEGIRQFLLDTHCHVATSTIALTADQGDYALPTTSLVVRKVWALDSDSLNVPLAPTTVEEILWLRRSTGTPPSNYYAYTGDLLMLYPIPTADGTLDIIHVPYPTALSGGSDDPSVAANGGIPVQYHWIVELFAKARAGEYADDISSRMGMDYFAQYEVEMKKARSKIRQMAGGGRRAPATPGRKRRYPYKNDVDTSRY